MGKCVIAGCQCPKTNNSAMKLYCPAWSDGMVWTNVQTGEEKIINCLFSMLFPGIIEVIKASNRPAAAVESCRNAIATGFETLSLVIHNKLDEPSKSKKLLKGR